MTAIDMTPRLRLAADYLHEVGWARGTERSSDGRVCLSGAIRYCAPQTGDEYLIREVLRKRGRAEWWNDREASAEEVEEYLRTAEVTDADLADTFGPQWAEVVALVRRATALDGETVARLHDEWAAGAAARAAARAAVGAAVGDAVRALAARHLIRQHGFTQAHYDILTGPWRRVVGPIHPDDVDLRAVTR